MKPYQLYLLDEHQLAHFTVLLVVVQVDESVQLLQLSLPIVCETGLRQTICRDMYRVLNDAVALVFGHQTEDGIPRS